MSAYKFMMYGVRKYFELKPERYKTNLNSFLLAHQQTFDGPGQSVLESTNKQTLPVPDLLRMKPGNQTKCNYTEMWGEVILGQRYIHTHMCIYVVT